MLLNLQNKAAAPETQAEETVVNIVKPKHNQMDSQGSDSRMAIVVWVCSKEQLQAQSNWVA